MMHATGSTRRLGGVSMILVGAVVALSRGEPGRIPYLLGWEAPARSDGVVLVILDNVRADHTSLCGYGRPTTPNLDALARGGTFSCSAIAPGTWTLPSHASFFTGATMLEHGAHELPTPPEGTLAPGTTVPIQGLDGRLPTLAEELHAAGFQTALVSSNPVVGAASGLSRGYDHTFTVRDFGALGRTMAGRALRYILGMELDPDGGPLFLTVNIADAHGPWQEVPAGLGWLPPRPALSFFGEGVDRVWTPFYTGAMQGTARADFLAQLGDVYDYGVWRADAALGQTLALVRDRGWCGEGCRVVVVSDHGEMLGEHDMIDHGFVPWEENARVPLVLAGWEAPALPPSTSAVAVHGLVRDGRLPALPAPPTQVSYGHFGRAKSGGAAYAGRMVSLWLGADKWTWWEGEVQRFALVDDPHEASALRGEPEPEALQDLRARVAGFSAAPVIDDALRRQLEAAGYLEPEGP